MAQMFPRQPKVGTTDSEVAVFEALAEQLDDQYSVIHSASIVRLIESGKRPEQAEADFLVLHPDHGWINIEVKGDGVRKSVSNPGWERFNHEKAAWESTTNPYDQVTRTQRLFDEWITDNYKISSRERIDHDFFSN